MRRKYISPEFNYNRVFGSLSMKEHSTFFGSKMMDIEDVLYLNSDNIIYYQNSNGEQLDRLVELSLNPSIYDISLSKKNWHNLVPDQYGFSDSNAKWIINISLRSLLIDYIFSNIKKYRSFEGISNLYTLNNNVDDSIKSYIVENILNKYEFSGIDLYIKYNDINSTGVLKYNNTFNLSAYHLDNLHKMMELNLDFDNRNLEVKFKQDLPPNTHTFDYYYNLTFKKI